MKDIRLIKSRGEVLVYPRTHLRWLEMVGDSLKFGFSSESVTVKGTCLELLFRALVIGRVEVIEERPARHDQDGQWSVHEIQIQPHTDGANRPTKTGTPV